MRLCLGGTRRMDISLEEEIAAAAQAGFASLDLWAPKFDDYLAIQPVAMLGACLQEHSVYIAAIRGVDPIPPNSRPEDLLAQARFLEQCTRLDALGGGIIVVHPGSRPDQGISTQEVVARTVRALRDLSSLAAPFEVTVALEFCSNARSLVRSMEVSQEIVGLVARENVGLALSTLQFHLGKAQVKDLDALDVQRLCLVRLGDLADVPMDSVRDEDRVLPGWGVVPLAEICGRLADRGYRGVYSVELPAPHSVLLEAALAAWRAASDVLASCGP